KLRNSTAIAGAKYCKRSKPAPLFSAVVALTLINVADFAPISCAIALALIIAAAGLSLVCASVYTPIAALVKPLRICRATAPAISALIGDPASRNTVRLILSLPKPGSAGLSAAEKFAGRIIAAAAL